MKSEAVRRFARWRDALRRRRLANLVYRGVVGVVGLVVFAVGIIAIPYPGPGWAIVFVGLGILATEFDWAKRLLAFAQERYNAVMAWFWSRGRWIQVLAAVFTAAIVVATLWLLGVLGWTAGLFGLEWPWLDSPLGIGS